MTTPIESIPISNEHATKLIHDKHFTILMMKDLLRKRNIPFSTRMKRQELIHLLTQTPPLPPPPFSIQSTTLKDTKRRLYRNEIQEIMSQVFEQTNHSKLPREILHSIQQKHQDILKRQLQN